MYSNAPLIGKFRVKTKAPRGAFGTGALRVRGWLGS
jgi:hypothetical protein